MIRREFLQTGLAAAAIHTDLPKYRVVSKYKAERDAMPGPYRGRVVSLRSARSIDAESERVDPAAVAEMFRRGMTALTGDKDPRDAWRRFIAPTDSVGIKLNCSGAPQICSHPVVVAEVCKHLIGVGVKPGEITLYERFSEQVESVKYERYLPDGVRIEPAGPSRRSDNRGYDPSTYVDVSFFGEDDTRSAITRNVTQRFSKIINIPNMKDHGASGVTGCLKNIAYGSFNNVARSHANTKTHTYSFIGTLAAVEPLRSRTVLQVMDGLKCVWHGGPFAPNKKFTFHPGRMMFGTDPVAIDRIMMDVVDGERKRNGAVTVWDRATASVDLPNDARSNPNVNRYVREPGHIEYAGSLGLGVYDFAKIKIDEIIL